jgi:DNA-binding transcriptional LysR family regulator
LVEPKAELFSLQQIRCFCAAAELGSFSAAADALRVSQPAVAEQIRKLEAILGTDLFVRAARGVVPTEAGQAFAVHATRSLQTLEEAAGSVGELTGLRGGTVAVGVFSAPTPWRLEELAATFLERHPGIAVRLVGRNSSAIAEHVRRGELEAGVVTLPIDDERLDVRPIVRDEVVYVTASPERAAGPATIERLAGAPLVFYDAGGARDRRHLSAERIHDAAIVPGGAAQRALLTRALRHLRDRHAPGRAPVSGRA